MHFLCSFLYLCVMKVKKRGRKPVKDKRVPIRFFVQESVMHANGGEEECQELCENYLNKRAKK